MLNRRRITRTMAVCSLCLMLSSCQGGFFYRSFSVSSQTYLEQADYLIGEGQLDQAIEMYKRHIDYRLGVKNRAEWENPYFYYLLIGDLYLKQDKPEESLAAFELAEDKNVERPLLSDRYRLVAGWYEKHNDLKQAVSVLKKYRDRDELMFDAMLDRLSKELTRQEERLRKTKKP